MNEYKILLFEQYLITIQILFRMRSENWLSQGGETVFRCTCCLEILLHVNVPRSIFCIAILLLVKMTWPSNL